MFGQEKGGIRQRVDEGGGDVAPGYISVEHSSVHFPKPWTRDTSYPLTLKRSVFI